MQCGATVLCSKPTAEHAVELDLFSPSQVSEFHAYVRPKKNKILSEFCTSLTGITQDIVDSAEEYPNVIKRFRQWLSGNRLLANSNWCLVTDG
jgi:3'-5' exoribonuclease 1